MAEPAIVAARALGAAPGPGPELAGGEAARADFRLRASIAAAAALLDAWFCAGLSDAFAARPGAAALAAGRREAARASARPVCAASGLACDCPFDTRAGTVLEATLKRCGDADPPRAGFFAPRAAACVTEREGLVFFRLTDLPPVCEAPLAAAPGVECDLERWPGLLARRVAAARALAEAAFTALGSAALFDDFVLCLRPGLACFAFGGFPVFLTDAISSALLFSA